MINRPAELTMRQKSKAQAGFSLIEVLVAVSVFVVGILAIASVQVNSIRYNAGSNTRSVAASLAEGVMEQILSFDENNAAFESTSTGMVWDLDPATAATTLTLAGAGTYRANVNITTDTPVNGMARIDVTVVGPALRTVTFTGYKRFL